MIVLHDRGPEAIAEEMSPSPMAPVEALGVDAVQPAQSERKLLAGRTHEHVVMRRHETPRVALPIMVLARRLEETDEEPSVIVIAIDRRLADAPRRHVKDTVRK
jgi:hypothetical protein